MSKNKIKLNKISRRLKYPVTHRAVTRTALPGQRNTGDTHRSQPTIYGKKLFEKQKVRFTYNLRDKDLKRYVKSSIANKKLDTLNLLTQNIECRLYVAVWRLIGGSLKLAKQLVSHKHVKLNGKTVNLPRHEIKTNDEIQLNDKAINLAHVKELVKNANHSQFDYFDINASKCIVKLNRIPASKDIPSLKSINLRSVVEFY